ncbi:hypothetical protein BUALT_Bualt08G0036400 [Buddleja alternifolia]|uniref:SWIM-type domain-containing protein n=1 Tax=Buddleja alternifolia TaxID=168488 RepID=A0AAV6X2T0_9LAMI|nr:hypothetical protein BUALT_Bualt08G0036400 [Buddleja alternifolia]
MGMISDSNSSEFNSDKDSNHENGPKVPVFSLVESEEPKFELGLCFTSKQEFRTAVNTHAIVIRRNIKITSNDKRRCYAKSMEEGYRQKGFVPALESVFQGSTKRFYVRHLFGNMQIAGFKGAAYKKAMCVVDLEKHSCSCRKWDLSGIPCKHAMSAINSQRLNGEDFVDDYYTMQTFLKVYDNYVYPVNGPEKWNKTNLSPPLPPNNPRGVGRPLRARKLGIGEVPKKRRNRIRQQKWKLQRLNLMLHNTKKMQMFLLTMSFGLSPEEEAEMAGAIKATEMEIANLASDSFPVDHGVEEQVSVDLRNKETENIDSQATVGTKLTTRNKAKGKGIALQDTEKIKFSSRRCCNNSTRKGPVFKAPRTVSSEALTAPSRQPSASLAQTRKSATRAHAGAPEPSPRPPRPQSQPSAPRAATTSAKSTSAPIAPRGATTGATRSATPRPDSPESATTSKGLKIRHVPLSPDHPRTFISMTMRKRKPLGDYISFIVKEGKKYVTMKNLNDALNVKKEEFEASQGKNDLFFVEEGAAGVSGRQHDDGVCGGVLLPLRPGEPPRPSRVQVVSRFVSQSFEEEESSEFVGIESPTKLCGVAGGGGMIDAGVGGV